MPLEDPVVTSLEHLAERQDDVSREIHRRFTALCPESEALMSHMDDYMVGRMMQDVLVLLMTPPEDIDRHYLSFEVGSHRAYGVTPVMFRPLLEAVRDTVREQLGSDWSQRFQAAWEQRIAMLSVRIAGATA